MNFKEDILHAVYRKIVNELDNGINSNFNEYLLTYNRINKGHNDSLDEIKKSFYQMAFCIEVRKTTLFREIERGECDVWYDAFETSRIK